MTQTQTKGERTAELFREAARRVFAREGYLSAKVEDIAAEAGKSPASFYNYFENKRSVLAAIADDFHRDTRAAIAQTWVERVTPEEALRSAISIWIQNYRDDLGAMSGVFQASLVDREFHDLWRTIRADAIRFIAAAIRQAQTEGYSTGVDPTVAASALSSMLEHFCFVWIAQARDGDQTIDEQTAVDTLAKLWFHSIYWRAPEGTKKSVTRRGSTTAKRSRVR